jgi:hypothetical protein
MFVFEEHHQYSFLYGNLIKKQHSAGVNDTLYHSGNAFSDSQIAKLV